MMKLLPPLLSRRLTLGSVMALATIMPNAYAQSTLEEIIVTAEFREASLQDTPIAITAFSDEMLRARGMSDVEAIAKQAPNVQIKTAAVTFGKSVQTYIRGIGQRDYNTAFEPGVGMYIDDVYFPTMTGSNFTTVDLERVEILRGPQGTLSGRNSIGGAIRLITRKPTGDGPGFVEVTAGDYGLFSTKAAAEFALSDNLALRVNGSSTTKDGYVDRLDFACDQPVVAAQLGIPSQQNGRSDCKLGTLGGISVTSGRASLMWTPSERTSVNLALDYTNDKSEAGANVLTAIAPVQNVDPRYGSHFIQPERYVSYETFIDPTPNAQGSPTFVTDPINHFTGSGVALVIDHQINDHLSLKSITAYRELENDWATAWDGSPFNGETAFNSIEGESFQQELRLSGSSDLVDYTLGAFYFTQENKSIGRINIGYQGLDFIGRDDTETDALALYGHAVWHLSDKLNLTTGLRYSDEEKKQSPGRYEPNTFPRVAYPLFTLFGLGPSGDVPVATFEDDHIDYRLSLDYKLNDDTLVYATYSTGFKSGGISPRFFFPTHLSPFDIEEVKSYEVGYKTDLLDNTLRVNVSAFFNDYTDQQGPYPGAVCPHLTPAAPCLAIGNLTDTEYKGLEVEVNWVPSEATIIDLSASWISAEYTRVSEITLANPLFIADIDSPLGLPEFKISLGAQHTFQLASGRSITPRIDINHEGESQKSALDVPESGTITVVNASLAWRSDDWEIRGAISNLTDEYYELGRFDNLITTTGFGSVTPSLPREFSITLRRNF